MAAAQSAPSIAGGNYSYCGNTERHGNDLSLDYADAAGCIAAAGFADTYLVPFGKELGDTLPFGEPGLTAETLATFRRHIEGAGLRLSTMLSPGSGIGTPEPVARYKRIIDQAHALGCRYVIDFGLHGDDSAEQYISLMRQIAPYAHARGMAISMKLHDAPKADGPVLGPLAAIQDAIGHPAFGLCMDPGNFIYYTAAASQRDSKPGEFRVPTEGLATEAHRFNTFVSLAAGTYSGHSSLRRLQQYQNTRHHTYIIHCACSKLRLLVFVGWQVVKDCIVEPDGTPDVMVQVRPYMVLRV
jgi:hypothetical protein